MNKLQILSTEKPLLFTIALVSICITILYSGLLLDIENIFYKDAASTLIKNIITCALLIMVVKMNWLKRSLLVTPIKSWHEKWWLAAIPMLIVAFLNLISIDFSLLSIDASKVLASLYFNFSTGVFEEVMLRGVCFAVLYSAWKDKPNALMLAAIAQALIFGLAHYVNLTKAPFLEVSVQVIYATLIGIGFAGLAAYSRSLWPPIILHTIINFCGTINLYFQPDFIATPASIANYIVLVVIITITCAVPGYILLRKTKSNNVSTHLLTSS